MQALQNFRMNRAIAGAILGLLATCDGSATAQEVSFNRDIRPILSNRCFNCHGPDVTKAESGLQLDSREHATLETDSGAVAIVPGDPDASELLARVTEPDDDMRMPPPDAGPRLSPAEVDALRRWIAAGAEFESHWSYLPPVRPSLPAVDNSPLGWDSNPIDALVLAMMRRQGLEPAPPAELAVLARRVALDLTGLPPTPEEVDALCASSDPKAYERWVDELLGRPTYGEHWARQWLDLARYADSAGYADDPPRTIWAYRDWVIRALNANMPFDRFTIEQIAGDLLPNPSEDQLIATAFHRNTQTNNEGGTNNEEFRNVAIVDRVNTTFAVWMGTTMACAQCHHHKYDPISQEDYFRVFAILNNTQDADLADDSPVLPLYSEDQKQRRRDLELQLAAAQKELDTSTESLLASQRVWETRLKSTQAWSVLGGTAARASGGSFQRLDDGSWLALEPADTDTYTLEAPLVPGRGEGQGTGADRLAALRLETLPDASLPAGGSGHGGGNFVITQIRAQLVPNQVQAPRARYLRVQIAGAGKILSLAEVEVFVAGQNLALAGSASQSSTDYEAPAELAIDGKTSGQFSNKSVTHTANSDNPWWELDLGSEHAIERIVVWNRTDESVKNRLSAFELTLFDAERRTVWQERCESYPDPSLDLAPSNVRGLEFAAATADYSQDSFSAGSLLSSAAEPRTGWAVGGAADQPHQLILTLAQPLEVSEPATIRLQIEQHSPFAQHLVGRLRISTTADESLIERAQVPAAMLAILDLPEASRDPGQVAGLAKYYREHVADELSAARNAFTVASQQLAELKPETSVLVLRERRENRRPTQLQYRGNYLDVGPELPPGLPAAFGPAPDSTQPPDRLALARWLVDPENPLTARVLVNRYWESLFGRGLIATSEEFGSQGEPPTHPELLDWLAVDAVESGWDLKQILRQMVLSATYRQASHAAAEKYEHDPENRWLARGPRVRLSGEAIRDQALFVSGLLSEKMYGPPVRPPQPNLGLTAAFGGSTDWTTSEGEDRFRRSIYTTWRRSNPYPSMAVFDAPNREVCVVRRNNTNTPLQALVTLNDPVFVEAAQALGRSVLALEGSDAYRIAQAFQRCLLRAPRKDELSALEQLYRDVRQQLADQPAEAKRLATDPLGSLAEGIDPAQAAAWTVVANVILNLDEMVLKR